MKVYISLALVGLLLGCTPSPVQPPPYTATPAPAVPTPPEKTVVTPQPKIEPPPPVVYTQRGQAMWYAGEEHGQLTASGDIYDIYLLTAAHATLPLGTQVRVTNLEKGKTVTVNVNDRLPSSPALIKLSYEAARKLSLLNQAHLFVEVHALP